MEKIRLGDRVRMIPETFGSGLAEKKAKGFIELRPVQNGTVTYIHPSDRWYQVTFDCGIKECYFCDVEKGGENGKQTRRQGSHYQVGG